MRSNNAMRIVTVTLAVLITFLLVGSTVASYADVTYYPSSWNGYKIYLSQAHIGGSDNIGCQNFSERQGSIDLSYEAAIGAGYNLVERGYKVRIGTGNYKENTTSSNSWGSNYHIPLHSNAPNESSQWDCVSPFDMDWPWSGTVVMYYSTSTHGKGMSESFRLRVGEWSSPGRGQDVKYYNNNLWEIKYTNAYAVYLESGFHTFKPDKDWILGEEDWAWRIGYSIDAYLGYP